MDIPNFLSLSLVESILNEFKAKNWSFRVIYKFYKVLINFTLVCGSIFVFFVQVTELIENVYESTFPANFILDVIYRNKGIIYLMHNIVKKIILSDFDFHL